MSPGTTQLLVKVLLLVFSFAISFSLSWVFVENSCLTLMYRALWVHVSVISTCSSLKPICNAQNQVPKPHVASCDCHYGHPQLKLMLWQPSSQGLFKEVIAGTGNPGLVDLGGILQNRALANLVVHEVSGKLSLIPAGTEPVLSALKIPQLIFFLLGIRES